MRKLTAMISVGVSVCLLAAGTATAVADEAAAKETYFRGLERLANRDYAAAAENFETSFNAFPNYNCLFNLALCYFNLSRYLDALAAFERLHREFEAKLTASDIGQINAKIEEVKTLLPTLRVDTAPEGVSVIVDDKTIGRTPLTDPIFLAAGEHSITLSKEGFETIVWKNTFVSGAREEKRFVLTRTTPKAPLATLPSTAPRPVAAASNPLSMPSADASKRRMWSPMFIAGLSGTVVMAGVSVGLWIPAAHLHKTYEGKNSRLAELDSAGEWDKTLQKERDDARHRSEIFNRAAIATTIVTGAFAVMTAISAILKVPPQKEAVVSCFPGRISVRF